MKTCVICLESKADEDFHFKSGRVKRQPACKRCRNRVTAEQFRARRLRTKPERDAKKLAKSEATAKRRAERTAANYRKNKEKIIAKCRDRVRGKSIANHPAIMMSRARVRAALLGVPFDLTEEDVRVPALCPVLGIPLVVYRGERRGPNPDSPSMDRFEPEKGYVRGNVIVISHRANSIKNNARASELRLVLAYVERENERRGIRDDPRPHVGGNVKPPRERRRRGPPVEQRTLFPAAPGARVDA